MEIAELLEFCIEFDIGGKLLDVVIIILYLCGKKKTAEELQAKKEKDAKKHEKKADRHLEKAQKELEEKRKIEEELKK